MWTAAALRQQKEAVNLYYKLTVESISGIKVIEAQPSFDRYNVPALV